jgi:hypothetical protein
LPLYDPRNPRSIIQTVKIDRVDHIEEGLFGDVKVIPQLSLFRALVISYAVQFPLFYLVARVWNEFEFQHSSMNAFPLFFGIGSPVYVYILSYHGLERH